MKWNDHYGFTDHGADGLINKGFRYYTITIAPGVEIDFYCLHMDAEDGEGDIKARASQLTQLATYIKSHDNGRPVLILGDTNCRYTRDDLKGKLIDPINAVDNLTIHDIQHIVSQLLIPVYHINIESTKLIVIHTLRELLQVFVTQVYLM